MAMQTKSKQGKDNAFKLSVQVKNELYSKGYSRFFNFSDYLHFKNQCKNSFNKVTAIVQLFILENNHQNNDYNGYIY